MSIDNEWEWRIEWETNIEEKHLAELLILKPKKLRRNVVYIYNAVSIVLRIGNPFWDKLH